MKLRLCGEDRGRSGVIIVRRDLDKVNADHGSAAHEPGTKLEDLVVGEAAMAGRAGARRDRRIETVDVDRHVIASGGGDAGKHGVAAKPADLPDAEVSEPIRRASA